MIELYLRYQNYINLAKDIIFFLGAWKIFSYLINKKFQDTCNQINENLALREKIEPQLKEFIQGEGRCIRFVHWKNYPWSLAEDGFKFLLRINYENNKPSYGWIDNTGINFEEPPLKFLSQSVYLDKNGIFFIAEKNKKFKNFQEIRCSFIVHLPFRNILNFDFKERIEYEPVFYTRYYYMDWKRNYDDLVILREIKGEEWLRYELSQKRMLKKYSLAGYIFLKIKLFILKQWKDFFLKIIAKHKI